MLFTKGREWKLSCSLDNLWIPCGIFGVYLLPILPSDRIREVWKQQLDNEKNKVGLTLFSFEVTNNHLAGLSCGPVHYAVQGGSNFLWVKSKRATAIQMKATKQYFTVVLFIVLNKVVLTFEFVGEIPRATI